MKTILITGAAGFIGYHICKNLLNSNINLIGLDNLNSYYDISLKNARLEKLSGLAKEKNASWKFIKGDLAEEKSLRNIFNENNINVVVNMAAQAGVRYSIKNPSAFLKSNLIGFCNLIQICREFSIDNFIYASSSSVYGGNKKYPFSEKDEVNHPVSLYAATKKSNELIAHSYSHLYNIPCTGLRLFTVYGPWGRPDMAPMIFTKSIIDGKPIKLFNSGNMYRDFTYVEDIAEIICKLIEKPAVSNINFNNEFPEPSSSWCPHRIFNIGNNNPIFLLDFINLLEKEIGKKAIFEYHEMQPGDLEKTSADITLINDWIGFKPKTKLNEGLKKFINWYKYFYRI